MEEHKARRGTASPEQLAEFERQLRAGVWLKSGAVAALLGLSPATVHRRLGDGTIGWRLKGKQRICDPTDVLRLLEESRTVHRGPRDAGSPASGTGGAEGE